MKRKRKARWKIELDGKSFCLEWDPVKNRLTMRERFQRQLMEIGAADLVKVVRGQWTLKL